MFTPNPPSPVFDPLYLYVHYRTEALRREAAEDRLATSVRRARRNRG